MGTHPNPQYYLLNLLESVVPNHRVLVDEWEITCDVCGMNTATVRELEFHYSNGEIRDENDIVYPSSWDIFEDESICEECVSDYNQTCDVCEKKSEVNGYGICPECDEKSEFMPDISNLEFCSRCGNNEVDNEGEICESCIQIEKDREERKKNPPKYGYGDMLDNPRWGNGY